LFTDLLAYQERQREDRRAALDQMTEDASEADLYTGIPEDYAMALKRAPPGGRLLTALRYTERRAECHAARSGWGIKQGSARNSSGQASICGPSFPGRPDLPSMVYIIDAMYEIDLEPEVEAWLLDLPYSHYQRVMRNVDDFLVTGGARWRSRQETPGC
jgi:hypothetical protein